MLKIHKDALRKTRTLIVETIQPQGRFWDLLIEKEVFLPMMMEFIQCKPTREERNRRLLDDVVRRGPGKYELFLECLREGGYAQLADDIVRNEMTSCSRMAVPQETEDNLGTRNPVVPSTCSRSFSGYGMVSPERTLLRELPTTASVYEKEKRKYRMESCPRGYALIINNKQFDGEISNRDDSDINRNQLEEMFIYLGFENFIYEDLTSEEMINEIQSFASKGELDSVDSVAIAVLSHGNHEILTGTDGGSISKVDIMKALNPLNCPAMAKKPKLIILNACRGGFTDEGVCVSDNTAARLSSGIPSDAEPDAGDPIDGPGNTAARLSSGITSDAEPDAGDPIDGPGVRQISCYQDFVVAYSTFDGFTSLRHPGHGSVFIEKMNEVFQKESHECDVLKLLTEVRRRVVEFCDAQSFSCQGPMVQLPETRDSLMSTWYLNPSNPPNPWH